MNCLNARTRQKLLEEKSACGPNLKKFLGTGWTPREQTAEGFPPCRSDSKPKQSPTKWISKILVVDHRGVSDLSDEITCPSGHGRLCVSNSLPTTRKKVSKFRKFTLAKIAENSIGPDEVINMDEVPLAFDLPLTQTANNHSWWWKQLTMSKRISPVFWDTQHKTVILWTQPSREASQFQLWFLGAQQSIYSHFT